MHLHSVCYPPCVQVSCEFAVAIFLGVPCFEELYLSGKWHFSPQQQTLLDGGGRDNWESSNAPELTNLSVLTFYTAAIYKYKDCDITAPPPLPCPMRTFCMHCESKHIFIDWHPCLAPVFSRRAIVSAQDSGASFHRDLPGMTPLHQFKLGQCNYAK